jgi:hypothetical protein
MSALAFFPWLRLRDNFTADGIHFLGYERGRLPFGEAEAQKAADAVLARYKSPPDGPVKQAVIVAHDLQNPTRELSADEIAGLFELRELITLAALSERPYFQGGAFQYCNSHCFSLIVQRYEKVQSGVSITSRRRDGQAHNFWSANTYQMWRPDHVPSPFVGLILDQGLLDALLRAQANSIFDRVAEAAAGFNLANTDSPDVSHRVELNLTNGAFERLFDCRSGREDDLAIRFVSCLQPKAELLAAAFSRTTIAAARALRPVSVREMWIRDLFRSRGDFAHGRVRPGRTAIWPLHEHLLLAAFIFPIAVKSMLAQEGLYVLTHDDLDCIEIFEQLCVTELFNVPSADIAPQEWPWNRVMEVVQTMRLGRALEETAKETFDE